MEKITNLPFSKGSTALVARLQHVEELPGVLQEMRLQSGHPVLVLVGGAAKMDSAGSELLRSLFMEGIVPAVRATGAVVIDGGTDAGVMQLMGQARATAGGTFPLIGVAPEGKVALPDQTGPRQGTALEPHHTHFMLIPGMHFGDESPWLFDVARAIAVRAKVLTILVDGGQIAWEDVSQSVKAGYPVVVIEGSGRTADELARALHGEAVDERASRLVASGLLRGVDIHSDCSALARLLAEMLSTNAS